MSAFVGRSTELQQLNAALSRAIDGQGELIVLAGEAGAGKSSLLQQFLLEATTAHPNLRILATHCSEQYGADEPYQPFINAFRDLLADPDGAGPQRGFADYARTLAPYWLQAIPVAGGLIAAATVTAVELKKNKRNVRELARELAPHWLQVIPGAGSVIAAAASTAAELSGLGEKEATPAAPPSQEALFFQYTELLLAAAGETPVVLVIEDLHWADRASISLLSHLVNNVGDQPALILGSYRPADVHVSDHPLRVALQEMQGTSQVEEVVVGSLNDTDLEEFVRQTLGGDPSLELVRWLEQRSGRNVLFFRELLAWLQEQDSIEQVRGEWALVRKPDEVEIPRTAASVIEKRLKRLQPDLYRCLEYASVEGDQFHDAVIARLLGVDVAELNQQLELLANTHRIVARVDSYQLPNGETSGLFSFTHTLIQDVLHDNLQVRRRVLLHRRMAEILEGLYANDAPVIAHRLAIHYDEGKDTERALAFSVRAADAAARVFALWDALDLLDRALRNATTPVDRLSVVDRMGQVNFRLRRYADAFAKFEEALSLAESTEDATRMVSVRRALVHVDATLGARPQADLLAELGQLEQQARLLADPRELCRTMWQFRRLPGAGGPRLVERAREALSLATRTGDQELMAEGAFELGYALMFGASDEALPNLQYALALHETAGNTAQIGVCHNTIAVTQVMRGDPFAAITEFDAAAAAFDTIKDPANSASVRNNLGSLLTQLGRWEEAERNLREALRLAERLGANARVLHVLENLGHLHEASAHWDAAEHHWTRLLALARETGYWSSEIIALAGLGHVQLERGDIPGARELVDKAEKLLRPQEGWNESRSVWQLLAGKVAASEANSEVALRLLAEGEEAMANRDDYVCGQFRFARAEVLHRAGSSEAAAMLGNCREIFDRLHALPMRNRAERLLNQKT